MHALHAEMKNEHTRPFNVKESILQHLALASSLAACTTINVKRYSAGKHEHVLTTPTMITVL